MRRGLNIAVLATASVMLVCTSCGEYNPIEPDIPTLDVFPDSVDVEVSCSQEFDAGFEGAPHVVRWYVDDVVGGDPRTGMITTTGTYVAPANASGSGFVTVRKSRSSFCPIVSILSSPLCQQQRLIYG